MHTEHLFASSFSVFGPLFPGCQVPSSPLPSMVNFFGFRRFKKNVYYKQLLSMESWKNTATIKYHRITMSIFNCQRESEDRRKRSIQKTLTLEIIDALVCMTAFLFKTSLISFCCISRKFASALFRVQSR
jgi:hypothetical protein